jgi:Ca2+-binding EF-hand superfamily protein
LIDYKDSARLSIDDFLKVLTEHKISFNINDTKLLFLRYDKLNSGLIKYNELFNDLKVFSF